MQGIENPTLFTEMVEIIWFLYICSFCMHLISIVPYTVVFQFDPASLQIFIYLYQSTNLLIYIVYSWSNLCQTYKFTTCFNFTICNLLLTYDNKFRTFVTCTKGLYF
jgi:hypothetical protein